MEIYRQSRSRLYWQDALENRTIQSIKMHLKIQEMGAFYHIVNITRRVLFFPQSKHDYKCDIDFMLQLNKQEVNINILAF